MTSEFTLERLKSPELADNLRRSVEALLNSGDCSNEEMLFYSGVLQTLNWVLLRDTRLPLFRDFFTGCLPQKGGETPA